MIAYFMTEIQPDYPKLLFKVKVLTYRNVILYSIKMYSNYSNTRVWELEIL